jgi:hypothetical protein
LGFCSPDGWEADAWGADDWGADDWGADAWAALGAGLALLEELPHPAIMPKIMNNARNNAKVRFIFLSPSF